MEARILLHLIAGFMSVFVASKAWSIYERYQSAKPVARITQQIDLFAHYQGELDPPDILEQYAKYDNQQITCMVLALYGEARGSTLDDQTGVAHVINNRVLRPSFPDNHCDVVLQRAQIESLGSTKKLRKYAEQTAAGTPTLPERASHKLLAKLYRIASDAYFHHSPDPTMGSTHFWSPKVQYALGRPAPHWSRVYDHVVDLGGHSYHIK